MSERTAGGTAVLLEAKARARQHQRRLDSGQVAPDYNVGLAATFTAEPLVPFLSSRLLDAGLAPRIRLAPYNQVFQSCLQPEAAFGPLADLHAAVVLWRLEEVVGSALTEFLSGRTDALVEAQHRLKELGAALATLRRVFSGTILVSTAPFPESVEVDLLAHDNPTGAGLLHAQLNHAWRGIVHGIPGVGLFDLDGLQRHQGAHAVRDFRKWYLYHQPYDEAFLHLVADRLGSRLASARTIRKCIVLDCDNTLWGGVVGEDGREGLLLGDEFPGSAYRDFQRLLLYWRSRGVLLALASKNNESDVWEVFDGHDAMLLRREHLASWRIDWSPKPPRLAAIAEELGIGIESLVFVDDDPREIEQMERAWPEVACVQVPADPALLVAELKERRLFDFTEVTAEDRERADRMTQERRRAEVRPHGSPEEFLASLEMEVEVFEPGTEHVGRVAQLINRTNQFNLSTIRRSPDEVAALLSSPRHRLYALRAGDRFGEYGLTGLAIVEGTSETAFLDTFLMSCRILGREVETALLAAVANSEREQGRKTVVGRFVPSPKNGPAADFLPRHGFTQDASGDWTRSLSVALPVPGHIRLGAARPTARNPER